MNVYCKLLGFLLFFSLASLSSAQSIIYVSAAATGSNSGVSWSDAYTDLQQGLTAATAGDEVWVAEGIYYPTNGIDRSASFTHKSGVLMYGGFSGTEQTPSERNIPEHATILSGDIGVLGDSTDNSYCVLYMPYPEAGTLLDGIIVEKGLANDYTVPMVNMRGGSGAGLFVDAYQGAALPIIKNCHFRNNTAVGRGGGVNFTNRLSLSNGLIVPQFYNCTFTENSAYYGGAIEILGRSDTLLNVVEFQDCKFYRNVSLDVSGAIDFQGNWFNQLELINCEFIGNSTKRIGGGVGINSTNLQHSKVKIAQCVFKENSAAVGVGIYINDSFTKFDEVAIDSCLFEQNKCYHPAVWATKYGAAFAAELGERGGVIKVRNCIVRNNTGGFSIEAVSISGGNMYFENNLLTGDVYRSELLSGDTLFVLGNIIQNCNGSLQTGQIGDKYLFVHNIITNCFLEPKRIFLPGLVKGNIFLNNHFEDWFFTPPTGLDAPVLFSNNIFWNNTNIAPEPGITQVIPVSSRNAVFDHNIFDFPASAVLPEFWELGEGNIFMEDPLFLDTLAGDFRVSPCSPARDAGSEQWLNQLGITKDLAGNPRVSGSGVDIGPYEALPFASTGVLSQQADCQLMGTGGIVLGLENGCAPYIYNWQSANGMGSGNTGLVAGTYNFTVTDALGQSIDTTGIVITETAAPFITSLVTDALCMTCEDGAISITLPSGIYDLLWSTGDTTAVITGLLPGIYTLTIQDSSSCGFSYVYEVKSVSAVTELPASAFRIYPNPSQGQFVMDLGYVEGGTLLVSNSIGAIVFRQTISAGITRVDVDLQQWADGIYYVQFVTADGKMKSEKVTIITMK